MHVANDLDGWRELYKRGLAEEDLTSGLANGSDLCVFEAQRLADFAGIPDVEETLDHIIDIKRLKLLPRSVGIALSPAARSGPGSEWNSISEDGWGRRGVEWNGTGFWGGQG